MSFHRIVVCLLPLSPQSTLNSVTYTLRASHFSSFYFSYETVLFRPYKMPQSSIPSKSVSPWHMENLSLLFPHHRNPGKWRELPGASCRDGWHRLRGGIDAQTTPCEDTVSTTSQFKPPRLTGTRSASIPNGAPWRRSPGSPPAVTDAMLRTASIRLFSTLLFHCASPSAPLSRLT